MISLVVRYLAALCLFLYTGISVAQPAELKTMDSLIVQLDKEPSDQKKLHLLNELAVLHYNIDLKKTLAYSEQALELANNVQDTQGRKKALNMMMRVHRRLGNFMLAVEYAVEKIILAEKDKDTLDLIDTYSSIGNIYSSLENYAEARTYLTKAYVLGARSNVINLSSIMNFIGRSYGKTGQYDSAEYWILNALSQEKEFPQSGYTLSYIYNNLAENYFLKGEMDKAIQYYNTSMALPDNQKSEFGITYTLNGLARIHLAKGEFQKATEKALESLKISKRNAYRDKTKESYDILYKIFETKKDYKNALYYYRQYNLYHDSIFSADKLQYIENLKVTNQTSKIEHENEILRKDAELNRARLNKQRSLTITAVLIVISLLGVIAFLYLNFKRNKKNNEVLASYSQTLEKQVAERTQELVHSNLELIRQNNQLEQFNYIIAHNLRAPVARLLGLTQIINSHDFKMPQDKVVLDKLEHSAEELDTIIFDLNRILDIKKGIHHSFEDVPISDRIEKVKSILREKIKEANVTIIENFNGVEKVVAVPAYIESIFYNLISNAIKYRSEDRPAEISITTSHINENFILCITDNGLGMDIKRLEGKLFSMYQRFHDHVEGKGIGLFLVKTQVEALNGKIEIESAIDRGTTFTITLPQST